MIYIKIFDMTSMIFHGKVHIDPLMGRGWFSSIFETQFEIVSYRLPTLRRSAHMKLF